LKEKEQESSEDPKQERLKRQLALLEAGLYVAGRPLDLKTLGNVIRTRSKRKVRKLTKALVENYRNRDTALEVLELEGERFVMQLKPEYTDKVRRLATRPLLSAGPLKTLSYIAFRQPIPQTQVIDVRGHHAYGHLKQLEEMELIFREGVGRKKVIRTTEFFADFFGLSHDLRAMKRQLKIIFQDLVEPQTEERANGKNRPQR
jgi:segregation and condensation protein B